MALPNAELRLPRLPRHKYFHQNVILCSAKPGSFAEGITSMNMITPAFATSGYSFSTTVPVTRQATVVVVSDDPATIANLQPVLDFVDLQMETVACGADLITVLDAHRPMAVIVGVDGGDQDGFYTMAMIARYNRDVPIMILTDGDATLMGAADAVQELCGLTAVTCSSGFPMAAQLVDFLFHAGRKAGCMRLVPI
jgi:CheY-like chemotaxis protein